MFERVKNNVDRALINRERVEIVAAIFFYWMLKRNVG